MKQQKKRGAVGASRKPAKGSGKAIDLRRYMRPCGLLIAWLLVALALLGSWQWLLQQLDRPIAQIEINGELHYMDAKQLEQRVSRNIDEEGVLTAGLQDIQQLVLTQPWVAKASVRRMWPGILRINLSEHVAVAHWGDGKLLNAAGEIFDPGRDMSALTLPRLDGSKQSTREVLRAYGQLVNEFSELHLDLVALTKEPRGSWHALILAADGVAAEAGLVADTIADSTAANAVEVFMGAKELNLKLSRFKQIYPLALASRLQQIERIDLRYTNGIAVRWRDGKSAALAHTTPAQRDVG